MCQSKYIIVCIDRICRKPNSHRTDFPQKCYSSLSKCDITLAPEVMGFSKKKT